MPGKRLPARNGGRAVRLGWIEGFFPRRSLALEADFLRVPWVASGSFVDGGVAVGVAGEGVVTDGGILGARGVKREGAAGVATLIPLGWGCGAAPSPR